MGFWWYLRWVYPIKLTGCVPGAPINPLMITKYTLSTRCWARFCCTALNWFSRMLYSCRDVLSSFCRWRMSTARAFNSSSLFAVCCWSCATCAAFQNTGRLPTTYPICRWLGSVTVRTLDLRSRDRGFNSRSGHYLVVSTWMGDCLWTGEPSRYITNHRGQLSLPSLQRR